MREPYVQASDPALTIGGDTSAANGVGDETVGSCPRAEGVSIEPGEATTGTGPDFMIRAHVEAEDVVAGETLSRGVMNRSLVGGDTDQAASDRRCP